MKLAITGQNGFIGSHLYNTIKFQYQDISIIDFENTLFDDPIKIDEVLSNVDIIVHLAGINRAEDQDYLYNQNIILSNKIIESIKRIGFKGKLIFASSIQEKLDNAYGKAKKESREAFYNASKKIGFAFTGLIIPNVFGPFCKPNYNSFIATFCNNSISGKKNAIIEDKIVPLIYIDSLIKKMINSINEKPNSINNINEDISIKVSEVNSLIDEFNEVYFNKGEIPNLNSDFKINLFNTFISFIPYGDYFPIKYKTVSDSRGLFSEVVRSKSLGQCSYSVTLPGETRGNHFHTRKIERFIVIDGSALLEIRKIGTTKKIQFNLDGKNPSYIDMPIWYTHNIKNIGDTPLITLFWINEFYNENDSDTFFEKV